MPTILATYYLPLTGAAAVLCYTNNADYTSYLPLTGAAAVPCYTNNGCYTSYVLATSLLQARQLCRSAAPQHSRDVEAAHKQHLASQGAAAELVQVSSEQ